MRLKNFILSAALLCTWGARADFVNGIPIHGFADVDWGESSTTMPRGQQMDGARVGLLDLFLAPQLEGNVKMLVELVLEPAWSTGSEGLDAERFQLGYTFSDYATLWAGRFHTPIGYWNTAYHHGPELQPTIARPMFIDFEDHAGTLPIHSVGFWLTGGVKLSDGYKLTYDAWTTNGNRFTGGQVDENGDLLPGITNSSGTLDMNLLGKDSNAMGYGANLGLNFGGALDGLRMGFDYFSDPIHTYVSCTSVVNACPVSGTFMNAAMQFTDLGPYLAYENHNILLIGEFHSILDYSIGTQSSGHYNSTAGYVHFGYTFLPLATAYVQYEKADFNQNDPYFKYALFGQAYSLQLVGLRYQLTQNTVGKLEYSYVNYNSVNTAVTDSYGQQVKAQYAVAF